MATQILLLGGTGVCVCVCVCVCLRARMCVVLVRGGNCTMLPLWADFWLRWGHPMCLGVQGEGLQFQGATCVPKCRRGFISHSCPLFMVCTGSPLMSMGNRSGCAGIIQKPISCSPNHIASSIHPPVHQCLPISSPWGEAWDEGSGPRQSRLLLVCLTVVLNLVCMCVCSPTPFAQAEPCPSTEWALRGCFQDFLGPLFFVVLNAGLGVCDAFVEGKRGSFMSVIVHSVHNNIVPHIATPCDLF
jgi:hypothetical protein